MVEVIELIAQQRAEVIARAHSAQLETEAEQASTRGTLSLVAKETEESN
jgi:hypothetical protein